jgi:hypothetical protein
MNRRSFIASLFCSGAVAFGVAGASAAEGAPAAGERAFVEVRTYTCSSLEKRDKLLAVFDAALVPALNRQGVKGVGVFWSSAEVNDGNAAFATNVFVVIAHPDVASFTAGDRRLLADAQFMKDAAPIFEAPMKEPLYDACSVSLLYTFATLPQVTQVTRSPDRLLQLRIYNSYTIERNAKKVAMFEEGGEIGIFRACGMQPVFFGQALAGERISNLTYMLGFDNKDAKEEAWKRFRAHPDWLKLKADPQYKDTANKITNIVLRPSKGSQL